VAEIEARHDVDVIPVTSEAFADEYPAPRPRSEMMRNYMLELRGMNRMRPWREALHEYLKARSSASLPATKGNP
jgi:RmlD substrate binding domain.